MQGTSRMAQHVGGMRLKVPVKVLFMRTKGKTTHAFRTAIRLEVAFRDSWGLKVRRGERERPVYMSH